MGEAYERRQDEDSSRLRSLYVLFCNIHRREGTRPIKGADVWPLFADQFAPKERITRKAKRIKVEKMQALKTRFNL